MFELQEKIGWQALHMCCGELHDTRACDVMCSRVGRALLCLWALLRAVASELSSLMRHQHGFNLSLLQVFFPRAQIFKQGSVPVGDATNGILCIWRAGCYNCRVLCNIVNRAACNAGLPA